MTREHTFVVYGVPEPQGSKTAIPNKRNPNRPFLVEGGDNAARERRKSWRSEVIAAAKQDFAGPPFDGPLKVEIKFVFPRPASARKAQHYKVSKPDVDKLARAVMDALTLARVIVDDSRVAYLRCWKELADAEGRVAIGAAVRITEMDPADAGLRAGPQD